MVASLKKISPNGEITWANSSFDVANNPYIIALTGADFEPVMSESSVMLSIIEGTALPVTSIDQVYAVSNSSVVAFTVEGHEQIVRLELTVSTASVTPAVGIELPGFFVQSESSVIVDSIYNIAQAFAVSNASILPMVCTAGEQIVRHGEAVSNASVICLAVWVEYAPPIILGRLVNLTPIPVISNASVIPVDVGLTISYNVTVSESLLLYDTVSPQLGLTVSDAIGMTDTVQVKLILLLHEYIAFRDTLTSQWTGNLSVSENIIMMDSVQWIRVLNQTITEALILTDSVTPELCLILNEYLQIRDTVTNSGVFNKTVSETLTMTDTVIVGWVLGLIESLGIADAVTLMRTRNETVEETLTLTDVLSSLGVFNVTITDTAALSDFAQTGVSLYLSESLAMTDGVTCFSEMFLTLSEAMTFTDALSVAAEVTLSVSDNIVFIGAVSSQGVLYNTIQDGFHLDLLIELDGEVYECWVLNTPGFYPSIYSGFDFNSYCEFDGRAFGANATGIFELTGDTDNGGSIHSGIIFPETSFGAPSKKRFRKAYLGVSGDAPVMMMETEDGTREAYAVTDAGKVSANMDIVGRKWKISIAEFDSLDFVKLIPVILGKGR